MTNIHFSGGNLLYVDEHVKWKMINALHASDFSLKGGAGATGSASDGVGVDQTLTYLAAF